MKLINRIKKLMDSYKPIFNKSLESEKKKFILKIELLRKEHKREITRLQKSINFILPKIAKIDAEHSPINREFRIFITLAERQIQECLKYDNDTSFIEAVAYNIGQKALYEIRKINSYR